MQLPQPGEQFQGKYTLVDVLGSGGFAAVYLAHDVEIGRHVAIKVLMPRGDQLDGQREARFSREATVIAGLRDPHTITMYDFGTTPNGLLFMVFEYVASIDLGEALRQHGPFPPHAVKHILTQLLGALGEAHASGILHRDLKPANVLIFEHLGDPYCVKLIDFGIAKPLPEANPERDITRLTRDGAIVGTPRYMAPEGFFGDEQRPASDLYSLGLVMLELLTGRPAHPGARTEDIVRVALSSEPLPVPSLPIPQLSQALAWMVERDISRRPASAADVLRVLAGPATSTAVAPAASRPEAPSSSGRWIAVAGAVLLVGAVLVAWMVDEPEPAAVVVAAPEARENPFAEVEPPEPVVDAGTPDLATVDLGPEIPKSGCGREVGWHGLRRFGTRIQGEERTWDVYVPSGYDPNTPYRVLLMFHNSFRTGQGMVKGTQFDRMANREGFIIVAPSSLGTKPWFRPGEFEYMHAVMDSVREELCVDERWLYAIGHGGGGDFALKLRCSMPLSAIAVTGSGEHADFEPCESEPTPVIRLWGNKDRYVPPNGGIGCYDGMMFKSAKTIETEWSARNKASKGPRRWAREKNGTCQIWKGEASFVSCEMDGGHDWPTWHNVIDMPGCGAAPPDFPIRKTIWRFFEEEARELDATVPEVLD